MVKWGLSCKNHLYMGEMFHGRDWLPKASSRHCQNQGAGMQDTKVPWPTQCKSALSVFVTGTLNMGSSCFGDGVHFEQILSRRAELCVSVWSIVCRHCQNQGAGMQGTKVPWPTQCKSALSVLVTGTLNHGVILFRRWGALWADFEQKSRTLCFCMVHSLQALSKSGCWDARHESSLTNPVQKRFVRLSHRNLESWGHPVSAMGCTLSRFWAEEQNSVFLYGP